MNLWDLEKIWISHLILKNLQLFVFLVLRENLDVLFVPKKYTTIWIMGLRENLNLLFNLKYLQLFEFLGLRENLDVLLDPKKFTTILISGT